MKPERNARRLLGITQAQAKMWEYDVPVEQRIRIVEAPAKLFDLTIGALGDLAAVENGERNISDAELSELRRSLVFASRFFDSFGSSRLDQTVNDYVGLCAASCYYLVDMPGSAQVIANRYVIDDFEVGGLGLERLLIWLLQQNFDVEFQMAGGPFRDTIGHVARLTGHYFASGLGEDRLRAAIEALIDMAYSGGSPRHLLFADAIGAIARKLLSSSTWVSLPQFSSLPLADWRPVFEKPTFMRTLWPAQRRFGEQDIFSGQSAVVQMPTSAGKTRATEILIRSAFMSRRTELAVIVAPFRALCREIRASLEYGFAGEGVHIDELTDVLQADFDVDELGARQQILVVTPEKLLYVLRQAPALAAEMGLIIYDEGHQFDSGDRGPVYELLLTSLKAVVPAAAQIVLISAVINNADQVSKWLLGDAGIVVSGIDLSPTYRSIAFTSSQRGGQLRFPVLPGMQDYEFFVPGVLAQQRLGSQRFPGLQQPNEVALHLGLKLCRQGTVAIFCGRKDSAGVIARTAVDVFNRGINATQPIEASDRDEIKRIQNLISQNLGPNSDAYKCTALGILAHHGNTPQGIRLAVEFALQRGQAVFVICTSTLAQGVNLPIRYLIVAGTHQGSERIKVRDFQNLIGRAGRADQHTEGTILFADSRLFDQRERQNRRWRAVLGLLDPDQAEACGSIISTILQPIESDDRRHCIVADPLELARLFISGEGGLEDYLEQISSEHEEFSLSSIQVQVATKIRAIRIIQSYLLAYAEEWAGELTAVDSLTRGTFAYFLADENGKQALLELFRLLAQDINDRVPRTNKRMIYGRTLLGVQECLEIEAWVEKNIDQLRHARSAEELLQAVWPVLAVHIDNSTFRNCNPADIRSEAAGAWIAGTPYFEIYSQHFAAARTGSGRRSPHFTVEKVVDFCDNGLSFGGSIVLGAIAEITETPGDDNIETKASLAKLQKRLKYGLPSEPVVTLFELGFLDRSLAQELAGLFTDRPLDRRQMLRMIRRNHRNVEQLLGDYPSYFQAVASRLIGV